MTCTVSIHQPNLTGRSSSNSISTYYSTPGDTPVQAFQEVQIIDRRDARVGESNRCTISIDCRDNCASRNSKDCPLGPQLVGRVKPTFSVTTLFLACCNAALWTSALTHGQSTPSQSLKETPLPAIPCRARRKCGDSREIISIQASTVLLYCIVCSVMI